MRQLRLVSGVTPARFQSTHPVWDATTGGTRYHMVCGISIHASRMGCDPCPRRPCASSEYFNPRIPYGMRPEGIEQMNEQNNISIHASRMGCDTTLPVRPATRPFQSTHPVWDATPDVVIKTDPNKFQSTHPVWDATFRKVIVLVARQFQSTHPVWDATLRLLLLVQPPFISIHASRMGCDRGRCGRRSGGGYFNPRIPYGMRLREWTLHSIIWKFLPALRADYIADIPEHLSVCIFGL